MREELIVDGSITRRLTDKEIMDRVRKIVQNWFDKNEDRVRDEYSKANQKVNDAKEEVESLRSDLEWAREFMKDMPQEQAKKLAENTKKRLSKEIDSLEKFIKVLEDQEGSKDIVKTLQEGIEKRKDELKKVEYNLDQLERQQGDREIRRDFGEEGS